MTCRISMKVAAAAIAAAFLSLPALAEVKPKRTELGGEPAQSLLWLGNSFFFIDAQTAGFLQAVAWDTVPDFFGRTPR